jgi:hypothetical protein
LDDGFKPEIVLSPEVAQRKFGAPVGIKFAKYLVRGLRDLPTSFASDDNILGDSSFEEKTFSASSSFNPRNFRRCWKTFRNYVKCSRESSIFNPLNSKTFESTKGIHI